MEALHIIDNAFSVKAFKEQVSELGAIDIETTIGNPFKGEVELVSVAVTFNGRSAWVFRNDKYLQQAKPILEGSPFIMHNGLFDRLMMKGFGFDIELKHDTMAMQYLLDPDEPKGLEDLSIKYLGLSAYKDVDYKNILDEPWEKVAQMNGDDVCRTYNLLRPLADLLNADAGLSRIYQWLLMPAVNELIECTIDGVPLDQSRLEVLTDSYSEQVGHLLDELRTSTPDPLPSYGEEWKGRKRKADPPPPFNPGSPEQVRHVLFDIFQLPPLAWNEDKVTGEPTTPKTDADSLLMLETDHANPQQEVWISRLREYRKASKVLNSYLLSWPELVGDDGRLHPRYKPLHVVTGRLSSEMPNIQNVPRTKEFRSVFGGEPGMTWLKADYSQIELRIAAWQAGEPTMLAAYRDEVDLHAMTAMMVLGDDSPDARQVGKTLNFGLLYGAGAGTLQRIARTNYGVFLTRGEAGAYREDFFRAYPALEMWHQSLSSQLQATGIARSPLGRVRYLPKAKIPWEVEDMRGQKIHAILEGTNHPVQSMASDLLLMSLVRVAPQIRHLGGQIVAEVHDEIDFLIPDENVEQASEYIKTVMEDVSWLSRFGIKLGVPVVADVETGPYWGEVA
jgi:DNA polymerase-1